MLRPTVHSGNDSGQALILFALMMSVLVILVMCVVDVGMFLHNRENAQNAADAAALAGAQDLPGNPIAARADALAYITKNGLSTANTTISLTCTSQNQSVCTSSSGTYDTVVVTDGAQSPTFFGGVLGTFGVNNCWVQGCTATATAAGCRGACGGQVSNPLDVVMILDRTGSMSGGDMANAQAGAKSILQIFNPNIQHVALGELGPASLSSTCGGSNAGGLGVPASSGGSWIPVPLSSDYQNPDGSLNAASLIVRTISCLQTSSVGTDLGDPVQAAMNYLAANGRPNVHRAIILETDGAANVAPSGGNNGPCDWAAKQAAAAKNAGIEIFTIGFGVEGDTCVNDNSASPFHNGLASTLLAAMATNSTDDGGGLGPGCVTTAQQNGENTDGDHFFCEAKGNSLAGAFQTVGQSLATGSKLVK